ncbi:MAG: hypothetical protein P0Y49_04800 [Candidatus Pedobacter colombiensis]|uniref:Uncharacterized protein n=1 Tax=Candidatus Pedobacter colombiensis TaxID=3121371 RepID=A0AAJ5WBB1_9SPHI|nr:hypothetical protein [Pedobacter sp.]WEK20455.1 MAG: hypothetical protein P0Y49_04800 [Pedobacter sp.]
MSFRTELAKIALPQINSQTLVLFEEMTEEIDLFDTAVAEYDGVILQLLFPNPAAGYPKFQLLKTDIDLSEPTSYFNNESGETDLTVGEVILLVNVYIQASEEAYKRKWNNSG